ncbi:DegQ family serine endoprotease [Dongia sp.]|uniref:DegQ family serine endoprotease n=1 Tax=Dongia sp. TaxID=1977262 RepID=UPI0035AED6D0
MTEILPEKTQRDAEKSRSRLFATVGRAALFMGALAFVPPALSLAHVADAKADQLLGADQTRPASFADLAAQVTPAVVNISSSRKVAEADTPDMPFNFPKGSPFEDFFRQFQEQQGGGHKQMHKAMSLGSGFVVDPAGYIVTNNHVIEDSTDITATLADGTEYPAKLIGTDPKTDLALLKVEAKKPLPFVPWGDSDKARVGDWVMAVGNPFGLGGSVTTGIVSARSRDIHEGPFDDFLQIDAAINQGNSGGPTFDMSGHVVGINTAIVSPSGGSVGIGFAIPSNLAKTVVAELKEKGSIERGWLGVEIQQVTPDLAQGIGLDEPKGALVANIDPSSPAAKADLKPGDVVLAFNGSKVKEMRDLPRLVADADPGSKATLDILRDGHEKEISVEIGKLKPEKVAANDNQDNGDDTGDGAVSAVLGAKLAALTPEARQAFNVDDKTQGVVIVDLEENSPLVDQGLKPGDVIERIGNSEVTDPAQITRLAEAAKKSDKPVLVMLVNRDGRDHFIAVNLKQA